MKIDLFLYSNWEIRTEDVSLAHRTVRCHSCISCGSAYFSHLCEQNWSKDWQQSSINASPWLERPVSIAKYSMYGLPSANVLVSIVWNKGPGACSSWSPLIWACTKDFVKQGGSRHFHLCIEICGSENTTREIWRLRKFCQTHELHAPWRHELHARRSLPTHKIVDLLYSSSHVVNNMTELQINEINLESQ